MNTEILSTTTIPQEQFKTPKPKRSDKDWTIVNKVDKQNDKIHRKFTSA